MVGWLGMVGRGVGRVVLGAGGEGVGGVFQSHFGCGWGGGGSWVRGSSLPNLLLFQSRNQLAVNLILLLYK